MSPLVPSSLRRVRGVGRLERLGGRLADQVRRRLGRMSQPERAHWFGASSTRSAARALAVRAAALSTGERSWVLTVGDGGPLHRQVDKALTERRATVRSGNMEDAREISEAEVNGLACIVCAEPDAASATRLARELLDSPVLSEIPLEYVGGLEDERDQLRRHDEYADTFFMSPVLLAEPSPYDIYEASLELFEQKCGLRDYLDVYQMLCSIEERQVEGAIAEFGSFRGHSGWLIARTLEALGSSRRLYMFDTFEAFPAERVGLDYFWSDTHQVSFEEVAARLAPFPNVELVQGEFTATLPRSGLTSVAMAYVDCDSYRAVSYVAGALFDDLLAPGGAMLFEDYGHPALLGCRVAVHEQFDGRGDCLRFLSQFSGVYIVVKSDHVGDQR